MKQTLNFGILNTLNQILQQIEHDAAIVGLTIAGLMIVYSVIKIITEDDTNVAAHTKRWETLRKVFLGAVLISAAGALISFGAQLGGMLHV
jgi:mannose/fructose/N-acetylgalactosamine-specific phosphotransferase system component IID